MFNLFFKGCLSTSSGDPLASDCNACLYVKNAYTEECLEKCPDGWVIKDGKTCVKGKFHDKKSIF